ncbi:hypothetical protein BDQ17DRAFT_1435400 [Cyathus striatus]|nr:hypothetical protein BDQ17DRAFT_1435400 [Cyathus striatus]
MDRTLVLKRPEWLGPRTAKAFRAAGLLGFDAREREPQSEYDAYTNPRGNNFLHSNSWLTASPMMRSASEYNPRASSRMAFSDVGAGETARRRGSESHVGLMESPTFTTSSHETPHSTSTAPTGVSSSFGYLGRERDREREREKEEMRDLKDKHATEMGALLSALSDTQRTARMLRKENKELRERLDRLSDVEVENVEMRRVVGDLRREVAVLKRRVGMSAEGGGRRRSLSLSSRRRLSSSNGDFTLHLPPDEDDKREEIMEDHIVPQAESDDDEVIAPSIQSTPAKRPSWVHMQQHSRRGSTTSSVFHMPPSNMIRYAHTKTFPHCPVARTPASNTSSIIPSPLSICPGPSSHSIVALSSRIVYGIAVVAAIPNCSSSEIELDCRHKTFGHPFQLSRGISRLFLDQTKVLLVLERKVANYDLWMEVIYALSTYDDLHSFRMTCCVSVLQTSKR